MHYEYILFSKKEGVGRIAVNRPKSLNSLTINVMKELDHALKTVEADETLKVACLSG